MINLLIFILKNAERKNKASPVKEHFSLSTRLDKDGILIPVSVKSS